MLDELVESIYEAAVIPTQWPKVLDDIAALSGSAGTVLFTTDHKTVARWTSSEAIVPVVTGFIDGGWPSNNPRDTIAARRIGLTGFAGDLALFSVEQKLREPMYVELLEPLGFGWFAGTHIAVPSGDVAVFDVERRIESGPMPEAELARLNTLRPHLARAALLSTRLGMERAQAQVEALSHIELPAAVLGADGVVLAANTLLENSSQVSIQARNRIMLARPTAQVILAEALARIDNGRFDRPASIPIPADESLAPAIVHLIPVTRQAHDVFDRARALLVVTHLASGKAPSAELLHGLFDLTPAEARVARDIVEGRSVEEIARSSGISASTIRVQLRSVFNKTGVGRQAELVRLLTTQAPKLSR